MPEPFDRSRQMVSYAEQLMLRGDHPAEILKSLLTVFSEEHPEPPPDEVPPVAGADEVPGAVEDSGPRPAVHDPVNHPSHYTAHPSGVECITVTEHMGFNVGNAVKYLWRADEKGNALEDLAKAGWYVQREIQRREHHGAEWEREYLDAADLAPGHFR
jgi:hypothetical protein